MSCFKLNLAIFALSLVACDDTISINCQGSNVSLLISPAAPIEFWPTNCNSFNENEICGVFPRCYCVPWECDDEIKIPAVDYTSDDLYSLAILDSDGNETDRVEFVQQELIYHQETDELEDFTNVGNGTVNWTISNNPSLVMTAGLGSKTSKIIAPENLLPMQPGVLYRIAFNATLDNQAGQFVTVLLDQDDNIIDNDVNSLGGVAGTFDFISEFIAPLGCVKFGWYVTRVTLGGEPNLDLTMNSYSVSRVVYNHLATVIPSDLNICDEQIRFKIYNVTASPDEEVYHSDCIDIKNDQPCTNLITYSHNRNLSGLIYTEGSPSLTLNIRVPSTMRVQQFPQEDFAMQLTTGVEKISGSLESQKIFEVDYVPYYFHRKLMMIFAHKYISIEDKYWIKKDEYVIAEGDRKQALKMGEVPLTEADFSFIVNN